MKIPKAYLGDGVYAQYGLGMVLLTTENGVEVTNEIYLDPDVLKAFESYIKHLKEESAIWTKKQE